MTRKLARAALALAALGTCITFIGAQVSRSQVPAVQFMQPHTVAPVPGFVPVPSPAPVATTEAASARSRPVPALLGTPLTAPAPVPTDALPATAQPEQPFALPVPTARADATTTPAEFHVFPPIINTKQNQQELENRVELQRRVNELTRSYDELRRELKMTEKKLEPKLPEAIKGEKRESRGPEARGYGRPKRSLPQPMYRIGWFWWRDNTKEIAGREPYYPDMAPVEHEIGPGITFGDGLRWNSQDKYFRLIFHNLTQLDLREPSQQGQPLHGGFVMPRQRWYFEGSVGDYADFVTSINRGYGSFDVLDSYVDFVVNREYLKFRVGRFKMPSQYEYIDIAEGDLLGPERSLFVANYAANRQLGAMAHGYLLDRALHYYAALGNGPRRSFEDFNGAFDYFLYLDYMPFTNREDSLLKNLHLIGTYNGGDEKNPVAPSSVQTMNQLSQSAAALTVSPTILQFGTNVFENGPRQFWGQELAYYYRSFGFLTSVQGGYQDYSVSPTGLGGISGLQNSSGQLLAATATARTHVPIYGASIGGWYFITGEEITRRRFLVEPVRPFGFYNGTINPGAVEVFSRIANLHLGAEIFSGGLVNQADWSNRAVAIDTGFNWYLNHFVKFTFDWQHSDFGNPVLLNPANGKHVRQLDMFLFRTQVFF